MLIHQHQRCFVCSHQNIFIRRRQVENGIMEASHLMLQKLYILYTESRGDSTLLSAKETFARSGGLQSEVS